MSRRLPILLIATATAALGLAPLALAQTQTSQEGHWTMQGCEGLATLALAPIQKVQETLPGGYRAQDAATFLLPGGVKPSFVAGAILPGVFGLVGVEAWKCGSITLGEVTVADATYGSTAAVVERPPGSPEAALYFYKYENFFSAPSLVAQSERLGAPAKLITVSDVTPVGAGATGFLTLGTGETYRLSTLDLGDMGAGSFQEWHHGRKGVSNWHASFTVEPGKQGTGTVQAPGGSMAARVMGSASGDGLGIHTRSTFQGGVTLRG